MEQLNKTKPRYTPSSFLGIIILIVGIYILLLSTGVIKSDDSGFKFGRTPVIFSSFFFIWFGVLIILYNRNIIKMGKVSNKLLFLISLILITIPVEIIYFENKIVGFEKIFLLIVIGILYVLGFYVLFLLIKNIIKTFKK
jgi:hypothetical protein